MLATQLTSTAASASPSNLRLPVLPAFFFCFIQVADASEKKGKSILRFMTVLQIPRHYNKHPSHTVLAFCYLSMLYFIAFLSYFQQHALRQIFPVIFLGKSIYFHLLLSQETNGQIFKETYPVYSFFFLYFFLYNIFVCKIMSLIS